MTTAAPLRPSRLRILVLGYIVRGPLGGLVWHHLQYVMGLARLGHDVYFLEDSDDYPSCYDPEHDRIGTDPTYGLRFAADAFARVGLEGRWAYHDAHSGRWHGIPEQRVREVCRSADLLLNLSAVNPLRPWLEEVPVRALVDTDPVFTQIRHLEDPAAREQALRHTAFFSFAENIGRDGASVPDDGLPWQPTRQPMVLDAWRFEPGPPDGSLTTVMQWKSYAAREYAGRRYGMKALSFKPYLDLPQRSAATFELALGSASAPRERLEQLGWSVRDSRLPTRTPWSYQEYLRGSKAEFGVAKHGYVVSRSGWFSERSAAYLASGRPVVTQETGFSDWLPAGEGLFPFATPEEALDAIEAVNARYDFHCRAARGVAEEHFASGKVLNELIEGAAAYRGAAT
ncbi:hypothetical protein BH23GEM7_BH23GEM7_05810 [soil metagenome]|nr:hypothetical protein [Gemmatimonadota bacterium]